MVMVNVNTTSIAAYSVRPSLLVCLTGQRPLGVGLPKYHINRFYLIITALTVGTVIMMC